MHGFQQLRHFPDFVKLSHSVFALPFALASLLLATARFPGWRTLGLVVAAVFFARAAAMAFNRLADASFDASNPRTAGRHLPRGMISRATAGGMVVVSSAFFVVVSFAINQLAGTLSPVALLIILGYSFAKRFTAFSHFWLGIALGLAPVGAWVAARAELSSIVPWLLGLAVMCWVAGFDMIYALQDEEFDRKHGLHSMVVALGKDRCLQLVRLLHTVMFLILVGVGLISRLHWPYFMGLLVVLGSLMWEDQLIRRLDEPNLQKAFLNANAVASFGYLGAAALGVYL